MTTEISSKTDLSIIRYAQCWEDADVLLAGLAIEPGDQCLSVASAGDNTLALLAHAPAKVIALDVSPAQLACLALRVSAYACLEHGQMLELLGAQESQQRPDLYRRCRPSLEPAARRFWDAHPELIERGIANSGRFERYLNLFRSRILPLIHPGSHSQRWLTLETQVEREQFYTQSWNSWRWRTLFRLFFSRLVIGRLGRDPSFFAYVEGNVGEQLLARTRHALTVLEPAQNPYLRWILTGRFGTVLPFALRPENFDAIRANLHRLEWHCMSVEAYLARCEPASLDRCNLSDIFEYMSLPNYHRLLERLVACSRPGARLLYWNLLVPRHRPAAMAHRLATLSELAQHLHSHDKAFFYSDLVIEEVS